MKTCNKCNQEKPITDYFKARKGDKFGVMSWCKRCHANNGKRYKALNRERLLLKARERYKKNPNLRLKEKLKERYGLTLEQYNKMLETQNKLCNICGFESSKRLCVDHDHKTGKVRALLCHLCNSAIGSIKEDVRTAKALVSYLEFHKS